MLRKTTKINCIFGLHYKISFWFSLMHAYGHPVWAQSTYWKKLNIWNENIAEILIYINFDSQEEAACAVGTALGWGPRKFYTVWIWAAYLILLSLIFSFLQNAEVHLICKTFPISKILRLCIYHNIFTLRFEVKMLSLIIGKYGAI